MQTSELRERLVDAFKRERSGMDTLAAYDLADAALKVFEDTAIIEAPAEMFVVEEQSQSFDPATDECPECDAAPGEDCGVSISVRHGYLIGNVSCPRETA